MTSATQQQLSLQEALESLTVGEVRSIEKNYGGGINDLTGTELTAGVIRALERRRFHAGEIETRMEWPDVEQLTMTQLGDYFAKRAAADVNDDEPESAEGKGAGLDA